MSDLHIASTPEDARAVEAVAAHHAAMAGALRTLADATVAAVDAGRTEAALAAAARLVEWSRHELVPHALSEEATLYPAAGGTPEGRLLVEAMTAEHRTITALVDELALTASPVRAASVARALWQMFESHLTKENDLVLPLLAGSADVSVAQLLDGMHEILGEAPDGGAPAGAASTGGCGSGGSCGCGGQDVADHPVLDARTIPHAIRHATIFGALDAVPAGAGLVLVAPHDPLPLLAQLAERSHDGFTVSYLERGPEAWRLLLERVAG